MKVLKILAIVFGVLFLLTGGGLLAGSAVVDKGQSTIDQEVGKSGLAGPVSGTVTDIDEGPPQMATVEYTDKQGNSQSGSGPIADTGSGTTVKVGDTVTLFYSTDSPDQIVIADIPGGANLDGISSGLKTGGIVCLVIGGVLLLAGILGLVLGKKKQPIAAPAGPAYGAAQQAPPSYPGGQYPPQQGGYPQQPQPPQQGGYPQQPPQQGGYPQQPPPGNYPPQQQPPQGWGPQGPNSAQ